MSGPIPAQPARRLLTPVLLFLRIEAASGVLLLLASALALAWANSPWSASYHQLWHTPLDIVWGAHVLRPSLLSLVNEGLMTGFFLLVGLELRREVHEGMLADLKGASLPLLAALGGVAMPALIYLLCAPQARSGWAIPTATDIAFAAGVLSLVAARTTLGVRRLLLTLAVADDLAALVIIAVFYSGHIDPLGLLLAAGGVLLLAALQRAGWRGMLSYLLAGGLIWLGLRQAGVHPTLAGVVLGLVTPVGAPDAPVAAQLQGAERIEAALHPWVAFLIMPLFALANAGVDVRSLPPASGPALQAAAGIIAGLVLGKPLGILLASSLALRAGIARWPPDVRPRHLLLLGCLGGIGFTMSMFLCNLAFTDAKLLATAKAAVVAASALAAVVSALAGRLLPRGAQPATRS